VIFDVDEGTIELRRLDYDIAAAQKKILDAGLPPRLAERLALANNPRTLPAPGLNLSPGVPAAAPDLENPHPQALLAW